MKLISNTLKYRLPKWERSIILRIELIMKRIVSKKTLVDFWRKNSNSEQYLKTWYDTARNSNWKTPRDVKKTYANASIVGDNRIVFNIKGTDYRLIVKFNYLRQWAFIRFIGTHADYDKINAEKI
jgi:mRNA interferase HigB